MPSGPGTYETSASAGITNTHCHKQLFYPLLSAVVSEALPSPKFRLSHSSRPVCKAAIFTRLWSSLPGKSSPSSGLTWQLLCLQSCQQLVIGCLCQCLLSWGVTYVSHCCITFCLFILSHNSFVLLSTGSKPDLKINALPQTDLSTTVSPGPLGLELAHSSLIQAPAPANFLVSLLGTSL